MSKKKVILIGPVYPYKGGISHYTGQMYRELAKKHEVVMLSYKMQYPRFLFHKEQKDYENDSFKVEDTRYLLHTANPFNIIKVAGFIKKQKPDMVAIQWWHPYFAPCYRLLEMFMGKQNVVFVCHNVFPHERFPLDKCLTKLVLSGGKHFVVHAKEEGEELKKIKRNPDYSVTPHPTYNMFRFENMTRKQAREKLGIGETEKILLFFGFVREYKGLKHLLRAMPMIAEEVQKARLFVVGDFDGDREEYEELIQALRIGERIKLIDGYTPDKEVEKYFAASDLVILPYESATQSGIVQIAFGFERPVIVSRVGGLPDVVKDGETGYVTKPCDPEELADKVKLFFHEDRAGEFEENIKKEAARFSWERMGEVMEAFF
ncbi:MAG: glycosyltransferase family 4 protein [Lachnospiraceae bacterium]|nr:glycosyltransferase family 4 protein [Lachnospiraceae bacterium]